MGVFSNIRRYATRPANRRTVRLTIAVAFELFVMVGLAYSFLFSNVWELRGATWWVEHTLQVIPAAQLPIADLVDAQSQNRDYLITGDPRYLDAMAAVRARTLRDLAHLAAITADNATQQANVARLRAAIIRKFEFLDYLAERRRQNGWDARYDLNKGRKLLHEAAGIYLDINAEENRLLRERATYRDRVARQIIFYLAIMLINTIYIAASVIHGAVREGLFTGKDVPNPTRDDVLR